MRSFAITALLAGAAMASPVKRNETCAMPAATDNAEAFDANPEYDAAALAAETPAGYSLVYQNQDGSSQGIWNYMGYSLLDTYSPLECSERCESVVGCESINVYFERDPATDPTQACPNPPSKTNIFCVYYGGAITPYSATNKGQYRDQFHVVIQGSNAYVNNSIATPPGYGNPISLGNAAIRAPLDCNGDDTYLGYHEFALPFDVANCAGACSSVEGCQFFDTYVKYKNGVALHQECALYSESWSPAYADNYGYYAGNDHYTLAYSYTFTNSTNGADQPKGCTNPWTRQ